MHHQAHELLARLRANPLDASAYAALHAVYREAGDAASLVDLVEGWAAHQPDPRAAAASYGEAAQLALHHLRDTQRCVGLLRAQSDRLAVLGDRQNHSRVEYELGRIEEEQHRSDERALNHYLRAIESTPELVAALYAARNIYKRGRDYRSAATLLEREALAERDPERRIALLRELAELRKDDLGDPAGAAAALERAHREAPQDAVVQHELANALALAGRSAGDGGHASLRRAAELWLALAERAHPEHSVQYLESALDAMPEHHQALTRLEALAAELDRPDLLPRRWIGYLEYAPTGTDAIRRRRDLGVAYIDAQQPADARVCLEPLLELDDPETGVLLHGLYRDEGDERGMMKSLEVACFGQPPLGQSKRTELLRDLFELYRERGRSNDAERCARALLELRPGDEEAVELVAQELRRRPEKVELRDHLLRSGLAQAGQETAQLRWLREALELSETRLRDLDGAIAAARGIVALDPADAHSQDALARLLESAGRWDELVDALERHAYTLTQAGSRSDVLFRVASIHRDERDDLHAAIRTLRELRQIVPNDTRARDELCEALLAAGLAREAEPLLAERAEESSSEGEYLALLRRLADLRERELDDLEGAYQASLRIVEVAPRDLEAFDRLQRVDERLGRHDRLVDVLVRRADATESGADVARLLARAGDIALRELGDTEEAGRHYARALDHAPHDERLNDAYAAILERLGRFAELADRFRERISRTGEELARRALERRLAVVLEERLGDPASAEQVWRGLAVDLEQPEHPDTPGIQEALRALARHARRRGDDPSLLERLERLRRVSDDAEERRHATFERTEAYARLGKTAEAKSELRTYLDGVDARDGEALTRLEEICRRDHDTPGVADALERQSHALDLPESQHEQVRVLGLLVEVYEESLSDLPAAAKTLRRWIAATPDELAPRQRLVKVLARAEDHAALVIELDALADLQQRFGDELSAGETIRRAASIADEELDDSAGAWRRLAPRIGFDLLAEDQLRALTEKRGCHGKLAERYVQLAKGPGQDDAERRKRWSQASEVYEQGVEDFTNALEATLRAFALDLDDPETLREVERLSIRADAWSRLDQVYDRLLGRVSGDERRELLSRYAALLEENEQHDRALERTLAATRIAPIAPDLRRQVETRAAAANRRLELLPYYQRRLAHLEDPADRIDSMLRAFEVQALGDDGVAGSPDDQVEEAYQHVDQALRTAGLEEDLLDLIESTVRELALPSEQDALTAFVLLLARQAEARNSVPLRKRCGRVLADDLARPDEAYAQLQKASDTAATDEVLDLLEQYAQRAGRHDDLDRQLESLLDAALDRNVAQQLLRRRARLNEESLARFELAADLYQRLEHMTHAPEALEARLRCLRQSGNPNALLVALDKVLKGTKEPAAKAELFKEMAEIWEGPLSNRFEALELYNKADAHAPGDPEVEDALARLQGGFRRLDTAELALDAIDEELPKPKSRVTFDASLFEDDPEPEESLASSAEVTGEHGEVTGEHGEVTGEHGEVTGDHGEVTGERAGPPAPEGTDDPEEAELAGSQEVTGETDADPGEGAAAASAGESLDGLLASAPNAGSFEIDASSDTNVGGDTNVSLDVGGPDPAALEEELRARGLGDGADGDPLDTGSRQDDPVNDTATLDEPRQRSLDELLAPAENVDQALIDGDSEYTQLDSPIEDDVQEVVSGELVSAELGAEAIDPSTESDDDDDAPVESAELSALELGSDASAESPAPPRITDAQAIVELDAIESIDASLDVSLDSLSVESVQSAETPTDEPGIFKLNTGELERVVLPRPGSIPPPVPPDADSSSRELHTQEIDLDELEEPTVPPTRDLPRPPSVSQPPPLPPGGSRPSQAPLPPSRSSAAPPPPPKPKK